MSAEVFTKAQFLQTLARQLKADLPIVLPVYNNVMLHSRGLNDKYDIYTPVDKMDSTIVFFKSKETQCTLGVHCVEREVEDLKDLLTKTHLVDWQKNLCFFHLPQYLVPVIEGVHSDKVKGVELVKNSAQVFAFNYSAPLDAIMCPAGMKICKLGKKGIEMMVAAYRWGSCMNVQETIKFLDNVPSVGLYPDPQCTETHEFQLESITKAGEDEVPHVWVAMEMYGAMGMMKVCNEDCSKLQGSQPAASNSQPAAPCSQPTAPCSQPAAPCSQPCSQKSPHPHVQIDNVALNTVAANVCARLMARLDLEPFVVVEDKDVAELELFKNAKGWTFSHVVTWMWKQDEACN